MRVGYGFDLHRLGAERPLRLGGVEIPASPGLVGHSDADCVLHAVADALLGAASLGDIGQHFPDTDPAHKDADSAALLGEVVNRVASAGFQVGNVDFTVLAERPKLAPHRDAMRERVAGLLGVEPGAVGVKFTTMEGLGPIGAGEAIACHAVALLETA
ncbi:MAG: 2-C-methyl-D-erythritol 2,4-cyclodiphosphate synthase [Planctomycetota bacterium]|jgi:2-C-methyl-D-erythritol 2,4-cyclodiphosphate synthase